MSKIQKNRQQLAWEQPYPAINQIERYLGKEVANLPNSVTEDVGGFSLCPKYSKKQLRSISRRSDRKEIEEKYVHASRMLLEEDLL